MKRKLIITAILAIGLAGCKNSSIVKGTDTNTQSTSYKIETFGAEEFSRKYKELPDRLDKYEGKTVNINGYTNIPSKLEEKFGKVLEKFANNEIYSPTISLYIADDTMNEGYTGKEVNCELSEETFSKLSNLKSLEMSGFYQVGVSGTYKNGALRDCLIIQNKEVSANQTKEQLEKFSK